MKKIFAMKKILAGLCIVALLALMGVVSDTQTAQGAFGSQVSAQCNSFPEFETDAFYPRYDDIPGAVLHLDLTGFSVQTWVWVEIEFSAESANDPRVESVIQYDVNGVIHSGGPQRFDFQSDPNSNDVEHDWHTVTNIQVFPLQGGFFYTIKAQLGVDYQGNPSGGTFAEVAYYCFKALTLNV